MSKHYHHRIINFKKLTWDRCPDFNCVPQTRPHPTHTLKLRLSAHKQIQSNVVMLLQKYAHQLISVQKNNTSISNHLLPPYTHVHTWSEKSLQSSYTCNTLQTAMRQWTTVVLHPSSSHDRSWTRHPIPLRQRQSGSIASLCWFGAHNEVERAWPKQPWRLPYQPIKE